MGERDFVFERSGESVEIDEDLSLVDVIYIVIDVEMRHNLLPHWRQEDLLRLAQYEAVTYLRGSGKSGDLPERGDRNTE